MAARWYVVNVYSGSEKKVAASLKEQAVLKNLEDKILDVLVPTEEVVEIKKGAKNYCKNKSFGVKYNQLWRHGFLPASQF